MNYFKVIRFRQTYELGINDALEAREIVVEEKSVAPSIASRLAAFEKLRIDPPRVLILGWRTAARLGWETARVPSHPDKFMSVEIIVDDTIADYVKVLPSKPIPDFSGEVI